MLVETHSSGYVRRQGLMGQSDAEAGGGRGRGEAWVKDCVNVHHRFAKINFASPGILWAHVHSLHELAEVMLIVSYGLIDWLGWVDSRLEAWCGMHCSACAILAHTCKSDQTRRMRLVTARTLTLA